MSCSVGLLCAASSSATVHALRTELLAEHLGEDTAGLDAGGALARAQAVARANSGRRSLREPLAGLVYALDPAVYGTWPPR